MCVIMSVPSDWIRDWCLAPEAWDSGSISHHSIRHIPFTIQLLSRDSETPLVTLRLRSQSLACSHPPGRARLCHEPWAWQPQTVDSVLFTQNAHSKGDLAQEEAVTSWQVPPRAAAVPAGGWCPITGVEKGTPVPSHPALLLPWVPRSCCCRANTAELCLSSLHSLPPVLGNWHCQGVGKGEGHTRSTLTPSRGGRPQILTGYCRLDGTQPSVVDSRSSKSLKSRDVMCGTTRTVPSVLFTFLATISEGLESLQFLSHSLFFFFFLH